MTQLVFASTFYQAVSLAAMVDAGQIGTPGERRILVTSNNAPAPELAPDIPEMLGANSVLSRFDAVHSWNDLIEPLHPKDFSFGITHQPMYSRYVGRELGLTADEPIELLLESLPYAPAGTFATLFPHAPISVHSDGLMSYGPSRRGMPQHVKQRLTTLHYTDLVPGLAPQLLIEESPVLNAIDPSHMRSVFGELVPLIEPILLERGIRPQDGTAVVLGQYIASLGLIDHEEEIALHTSMVDAAAERGCTRIIFKPHPASHQQTVTRMAQRAAGLGIEFCTADVPVSAEVLFEILRPALVVSCFSTALATADAMYGIPAIAVGTEALMKDLAPFENSNRVPLVIADYLYGSLHTPDTQELQALTNTVAYCMQPELLADRRDLAEDFLRDASMAEVQRYFKRRRLTKLDLPGRLPPREPRTGIVYRAKRVARRGLRTVSGLVRKPNRGR
ncbi:polysialyltransferase family glycosyltransferase [Brevibacterium samyangense]|uniref:Alpha-2,8-polysialyltransferase family protein n=1 Tax=Brevibacterium samyangense TaxID=366888 RepID=A0ABN2T9E9_9MICO